MKYRKLGNSGLIVSAVGLGTMQFGKGMNMGNLGQKDTDEMIHLALDHGINYIDTADVYSQGESEKLVGKSIRDMREELVISTKARLPMGDNFNHSGAHRVNLMREVERSLKRLQTDYIDLYQIHGWDSTTPLEETLRTLDDLVKQGKVRYIGFSNYHSWQAATALGIQEKLGLEKFITGQMYYSLVGRDLENDFMSFAGYHNIGILVWSPLAGGFLAGKYDRENPPEEGTRFAEAGQFVPFDIDHGFEIVDALKEVGVRHGVSPARVALAWTLSRPMVSSVLIAGRKKEHLEDNIKSVDLQLTPEDMSKLDTVSDTGTPPYPKWMVLQLDQAEDPRPKTLHPEQFENGGPWEDLRFRKTQLEK
ncbi:MAG: aldo/keto reductase [Candidatus Marinimicrobia bacterium]|nr:aldo/keto reductase [Candidatus Neomarinimicrobiota bacterium]